jgi:nucleoside-diphosphate-sugar epimerase
MLKNKTILISGSRGVIGTQLFSFLVNEGYHVLGTKRPEQIKINNLTEIDIEPWKIPDNNEFKIDLIIHLAAKYSTELNIDQIKVICDSNIGLASSIGELASVDRIPVIAFGTFVEKYPGDNGLTYYANSRKISNGILFDYAGKFNFGLDYVYMYDSYSTDTSRGKFIDGLINQGPDDSPLNASSGYQVQDLVYIEDVLKAINGLIKNDNRDQKYSWQIRTGSETTLRSLAELISEIKGFDLKIKWGHFPYGDRDVFKLWDCADNLLDFKNLVPLRTRLTDILSKKI